MLIRFRVSNYKSLQNEQELSLVASSLKDDEAATIYRSKDGINVLRAIALYGANASGKSNVLGAIRFMSRFVVYSQTRYATSEQINTSPFILDKNSQGKPSEFEVDIVVNDIRYRYGFAVDRVQVNREWLFAYPKGKPQEWFSRDIKTKNEFKFGRNLKGRNTTIAQFTRTNSLFLSSAAQHNHPTLSPIYNWFQDKVRFADPFNISERLDLTSGYAKRKKSRKLICDLLQLADLGITDLEFIEKDSGIVENEIEKKLSDAISHVFQDMKTSKKIAAEIKRFPFEHALNVRLAHKVKSSDSVFLDFKNESRGTIALFSMIGPVLWALTNGGVLIVDELEASLHPMMARNIVEAFNDKESNPSGAQLIFSTHSTGLLRDNLLRRDQIWFTEKDHDGATHLYPLTDFKPRGTENKEKGYVQGRYGAIPFLGSFDILASGIEEDGASKKANTG